MQQNLDHFRTIFFEECSDLLSVAESHLSKLNDASNDDEDIHAIFRAVHSVKGGAGTFGFDDLVKFAHILETALDILRSENIEMTHALVELLLRANDVLVVLVQNAENNVNSNPPQLESVRTGLLEFIENENPNRASVIEGNKTTENASSSEKPLTSYKLTFTPNLDMMRFGNEPFLILRELSRLCDGGSYTCVANINKLPQLSDYNPENCYISWDITFKTDAPRARVEECFDFVSEDSTLEITEDSLENDNLVPPSLSDLMDVDHSGDAKDNSKKDSSSQKVAQQGQDNAPQQIVHSIRVELDRIDHLVNTVGEMVIKQAMLLDCAQTLNANVADSAFGGLLKGLDELTNHTRELQESVMSIRAQPVKAVFSRMPRLVRELALNLGKDVRLEMDGENTEIDKTVIERLGEPLTHMIRNALDHGIESPEERVRLGKTEYGTIRLSAEHKSGRIVIKIEDDGRGINRERVLEKAKAQGILPPEANPTGEEIDHLVFHPGFSTAAEVTNISGRGVGMDVVKKSIQALGGRITIHSVEGQGCSFNLLLPLTLAVLDGMLVKVGQECFVIPIIHIMETIRPPEKNVHKLVGNLEVLDARNKNIPLVYLHQVFGVEGAITDPTKGIVVIVETEGGEEVGLVVDELVAQQQVVLKSLEANYDPIAGISAATILGNGRVSLILDVNAFKKRSIH